MPLRFNVGEKCYIVKSAMEEFLSIESILIMEISIYFV